METDDLFCVKVSESGKITTKFYSTMAKVSVILYTLDKKLLSLAKGIKHSFDHILCNDISENNIKIAEDTANEGEINEVLRRYMKNGKELILSSLIDIETIEDLDFFQKKISSLCYETQEYVKSNDYLDFVLEYSVLKKEHLARILWDLWLFYNKKRSSIDIYIKSIEGSPRVAFHNMPPLYEWLPPIIEKTGVGRFELTHINFRDSKKWKAILLNYIHDRPLLIEIEDLEFLEGLKSTDENNKNGILNGDVLKAIFTIVYDPVKEKTTTKIIKVLYRSRGSQFIQQDLLLDDDTDYTAPSSKPVAEVLAPKSGKKKHDSWK